MAEGRDTTSEQVSGRLDEAQGVLAEAKRIFDEETTAEHRSQWPNVFRLESATEHAQQTLTLADPQITQEDAANELVESATQARDCDSRRSGLGGWRSHWFGKPTSDRYLASKTPFFRRRHRGFCCDSAIC
jgi:hypothetical protein